MTSNNLSSEVNQRNWKDKVSTVLKKEAMTGNNWRSKSHYKKA